MARSKYLEAPTGTFFGKWIVLGYSHYNKEHYWKVECLGCNTEYSRRAGQLVKGRTSSCQSCNSYEREKYSFWSGIDGVSSQYISKLKHRNKYIDLTLQDIVDQWKKQKGICVYSGVQLTLVQKDTGWTHSTASLDRIDSSIGYVVGNVQWVHKRINTMKNDMSEHEFIVWCQRVVNSHGGSCGV